MSIASERGHVEALSMLIGARADIDAADVDGHTPPGKRTHTPAMGPFD